MDKLVPMMYKEYGEYVNSSRMFPLDLDGLKPVERRVLLSTYQIARDKTVKCVRIDGHTIGHYHPHGNVYGTIVQLVHQGFLDKQGNFGCNFGVERVKEAAARYTECKLSNKIKNMAFNLIQYVPWQQVELDKEPLFIPTMFPFCLMGNEYTLGIGFGYRTQIPCYELEDLKKRLFYLLGKRKTKPTIKPKSKCKIKSSNKVLEELLTTGRAKIDVEGLIKIDPVHCKASIKAWPPGKSFESLLKKFSKELESKDIGFTDLSVSDTNIVFEVLKQRNRDVIFKKFVEKLKEAIKGSISFETIVVNLNKEVKNNSIDDLLLATYNMYVETNKVMLNSEIQKIKNIISEYKLLEKIRPELSKYLSNKIINVDEIIIKISEKTKIEIDIIKGLFSKYTINKLLSITIDINSLLEKSKQLQNNLDNIQAFILNQYEEV